MKSAIKILCISVLLLSAAGCGANVRTYTFEVDRTDQELVGNRGYIMGTPPPAEKTQKPTRSMMGVDVELPTCEEAIEETGLTIFKENQVK